MSGIDVNGRCFDAMMNGALPGDDALDEALRACATFALAERGLGREAFMRGAIKAWAKALARGTEAQRIEQEIEDAEAQLRSAGDRRDWQACDAIERGIGTLRARLRRETGK